jgi:arylsulfatase A-like enzyme
MRRIARAVAVGARAGGLAGLALGALEAIYVGVASWAFFGGVGEGARFAAVTLSLVGLGGVALGAAAGLTLGALDAAAERLGARGGAPREAWLAPLVAVAAAGPVALFCAQIFRGPRARAVPGHDLIAAAIAIAMLAALWLAVRQIAAGPAGAAARRWAAALAGAAALAYVADQRILVRLYPFFHDGLAACALAAAGLAVWLAAPAARLGRRHAAALAFLFLGALGAAAQLRSGRALRTLLVERSALAARVARRLPGRALPMVAARAATTAPLPIAVGPRLGDVDVFLITVDALRADRLAPRTAPRLHALAEAGVVFDRAYAQVPHTSFSIATLLTGKYVYSLAALGTAAERHQTLAEVLRRERYKTAAFYPPSVFYIDHDRLKGLEASAYGFEYVKYEYLGAPARTDQVIRFLEDEHPARAFVWVHYLEPHEPYELHPGVPPDASAEARYDGEVRFVDAEAARLVEYVRRTRPRALVVVAADHGEEFGEHGGRYHGTTLYEEQVRVPLSFTALDGALAPRHVGGPVGLVDVAPTLLSLLGVPPSARMRGRDLGPFMGPLPGPVGGAMFAEIDRKKMVVEGQEKLVCELSTDDCQLFDLARDPAERRNLIDDAARAAPLRARLGAWMAEQARFERDPAASLDAAERRALESGRLGDRGALPGLARLLAHADPSVRREAAHLVATLPPDAAARAALAGVAARTDDPELADWAAVSLARLGDAAAATRVRAVCARACDAGDGPLCAAAALSGGDADGLARALALSGDDRERTVALVRALGATRDPRALDPLLVALAGVRTRLEVVDALGALGDARALPTLVRWVGADPYIPVRAAMARLIGRLAAPTRDPDALRALEALLADEREAPVRAAASEALAALGAAPATSPPPRRAATPGTDRGPQRRAER